MHKTRRTFIIILFFALAGLLAYGFFILEENPATGHKCIGSAMGLGMFVLMPTFIYHRWKGRSVKDYMLTEDNIRKMQAFNNEKTKRKS